MDKQRYIWLDGEKIYVSEEVYRAYYRPVWREIKQDEVRKEKECSLETIRRNGYEIADSTLVEEAVAYKLLLDELYSALDELTVDERNLIDAIYFNGETAREYARKIGTNHTKVNRRHKNALEKLKNLLKKYL